MPCDDCSRSETCPPCEDARFELFNELRQWMHSHTANALIDAFARQLAERQRQWANEENFILPVEVDGRDVPLIARQVAGILANLIDPKSREEHRP